MNVLSIIRQPLDYLYSSMIASTPVSTILLKSGTILQHDADDEVRTLRDTDLLVVGSTIVKIGKNLAAPADARVIDCHGKIVSPGFVDTHHHVWQTQLKGRHSDDTLLDYTAKGNWQPFNYTARDVFWGELGGLLESIDGGTTCVVDHAHMAYSPSHGQCSRAFAGFPGAQHLFRFCRIRCNNHFRVTVHLLSEHYSTA